MKLLLILVLALPVTWGVRMRGRSGERQGEGAADTVKKNEELRRLMQEEMPKIGFPVQTATSAVFDYVSRVQPQPTNDNNAQNPWIDYAEKVDAIMNQADVGSAKVIKDALHLNITGVTTEELAYHYLNLLHNLRHMVNTATETVILFVENAAFDTRPVEQIFDFMFRELHSITDPLIERIASYLPPPTPSPKPKLTTRTTSKPGVPTPPPGVLTPPPGVPTPPPGVPTPPPGVLTPPPG